MTENSITTTPAPPVRFAGLRATGQRIKAWTLASLDLMRLLTERIMGFLRLFATLGLLLIVLFVVAKAVQSSRLVLVKPFAVPKSMSDNHSDAGRVIANALKQELLSAETDIYNTVKRTSRNGSVNIEAVTGNSEDYLLGSSIKLPETGISINDVVEFIASLFGRRNITGSVYQDQGKLFLQVELDGRIFTFERELKEHDPKALNIELIRDMLLESRTQLLSVASESHNLYYYCSGETSAIQHPDSHLATWFDYCSQLQSSQMTPEALGKLLEALQAARTSHRMDDNDTLRHILGQTIGAALDKTRLLCPDYSTRKVCTAAEIPETAQVAIRLPAPPLAAPAPSSALPELPDASMFNASPMVMRSRISVLPPPAAASELTATAPTAPLIELPSMQELQTECSTHPPASAQDMLASNRSEGDATLLFNNNRPIQALEKYTQAIRQNCQNAFAWANMGVLLMTPNTDVYSPSEARIALEAATGINPRIDWMQNSLCIARAYNAALTEMVGLLNTDPACTAARTLNPANKLLLDKQFYLAVADRYLAEGEYASAADTYQIALSADRKRDCSTSKAISQLQLLETQQGITGAKQAACNILQDAAPLPGGKISACEDKLAAFQCP